MLGVIGQENANAVSQSSVSNTVAGPRQKASGNVGCIPALSASTCGGCWENSWRVLFTASSADLRESAACSQKAGPATPARRRRRGRPARPCRSPLMTRHRHDVRACPTLTATSRRGGAERAPRLHVNSSEVIVSRRMPGARSPEPKANGTKCHLDFFVPFSPTCSIVQSSTVPA